MGRNSRVEVDAPPARELAELDVITLRVQAAHDVAQATPRVEVAAERRNLVGLPAELEKAEVRPSGGRGGH